LTNHIKVISFPSPAQWIFRDFVDSGVNRIQDWYEGLSEEAQDQFDSLLKNTSKIPNHLQWGGFKFLKGEAKKERLWQLDFFADDKQFRVIGVFGLGQKQAALILGCYHKGPVYTPRDAIETACKRAKALREGKAGTLERPITKSI
jgi:hypothetical protein